MADSNEEETPETKIPNLNLPLPTFFSLLLIQDPIPLIFPPKNHENLHVTTHTDMSSFSASLSSSSSSTFSISPFDDSSAPTSPIKSFTNEDNFSNEKLIPNLGFWGLFNLGLGLIFDKFNGFLKNLKKPGFFRVLFLVLKSPIGVLLVLLYFRWWRRRRRRILGYQHLNRVIREKDERITELLAQIARMNEVLLLTHKVPSSSGG